MNDVIQSNVPFNQTNNTFRRHHTRTTRYYRWMTCRLIVESLAAADALVLFISGIVSQLVIFRFNHHSDVSLNEYLPMILIGTIFFHIFSRQKGHYKTTHIPNAVGQLSSLIYICGLTFITTFVLLFFLKASASYSRLWFASWAVLSVGSILGIRLLFAKHIRSMTSRGFFRRTVGLVGAGRQFDIVKANLIQNPSHFEFAQSLKLTKKDLAENVTSPNIQAFIAKAQNSEIDEIIIAMPSDQGYALENVVSKIRVLTSDIKVVPDLGGANIPLMHLGVDHGLPLLTTISKPISEEGAFLKAVEDYVIASIAMFLALPVMLMIALAIKLDSKGPVLFRQSRHGYNHQIIEVLKFRSMTVTENGDKVTQATKNDKRVTTVGRFLRKSSLDELPQLINVLLGQMSIVGPRPHAVAHNTYYEELVANYANRHRVKPGITGWAQVNGCRGETKNPEMMAARVRYDLEYIENWSLWMDIKIIIMTPLFGLFRGNAY